MRILFLGLNYAPEQIGIAVYSTGLCESLTALGHEVRAIVGQPYYPEWRVHDGYGGGARSTKEQGVLLTRLRHYVPSTPTGVRRILHHASFGLSVLWPMLTEAHRFRPDVVVTTAPSLIAAPAARLASGFTGAASWLHIQDFEVEAALATGLFGTHGSILKLAKWLERRVLGSFDRVSSISAEMCDKAVSLGVARDRVCELRNWANLENVFPLERSSLYRHRWSINTPHVALYSGNIGKKQGVEILVDAAREMHRRDDLTFVICGQGPNRAALEKRATGLTNIQFHDLQPVKELNELLGLATVHLLPQKASAADLLLPSKLTNMLASGRPVVATAHPETGLAREVTGVGLVTVPDDVGAFVAAITKLLDNDDLRQELGESARSRAEQVWERDAIIANWERALDQLVSTRTGK